MRPWLAAWLFGLSLSVGASTGHATEPTATEESKKDAKDKDPPIPIAGRVVVGARPSTTIYSKLVERELMYPVSEALAREEGAEDADRTLRVSVQMTAPPPSRMRILFTDETRGASRQVEFEPALSPKLVRTLSLPKGVWRISSWSDPLRDAGSASTDHSWQINVCTKFDLADDSAQNAPGNSAEADRQLARRKYLPKAALRCTLTAGAAAATNSRTTQSPDVARLLVVPIPMLDLKRARERLATSENAGPALSGRAFGSVLSGAADEALSLVTEVVLERARSRGATLFAEQLKRLVCEDLKIAIARAPVGNASPPAGSVPDAAFATLCPTALTGKCEVIMLPSTCQLLEHVRVEDLLGTGKNLLAALTGDVAGWVMRAMLSYVASATWQKSLRAPVNASQRSPMAAVLQHSLEDLADTLSQAAIDRKLRGSLDAQRLLLRFINQDWTAVRLSLSDDHVDNGRGLQATLLALELGLAVVEYCHEQGCDARDVQRTLEQAYTLFVTEEVDKPVRLSKKDVQSALQVWPDLDRFVLSALAVLSPPQGVPPAAQLVTVANLFFDLFEHLAYWRTVAPSDAALVFDINKLRSQDVAAVLNSVRLARSIVTGALKGDIQWVLTGAAEFLQTVLTETKVSVTSPDRLPKLWGWMAAAAGYLATYVSTENSTPEHAKELHQARKRAIESLIDAATNRANREGQVIFSLGVPVGAIGGAQYIRQSSEWSAMYPQLSVGLGVALQLLPVGKLRDGTCGHGAGLHVQLLAIDLAQYVAYDSTGTVSRPSWSSSVTLGVQVGALLGTAKNAFLIGLDARYTPTLFPDAEGSSDRSGALRLGLFLGTYIPLFDFN